MMFKESEFKRRMRVIGDYPNSSYQNSYPMNLLYWDGTRWWGDCVNIYKALFNGRDVDNPEVNSFQRDLSATSDCTEWGLIQQCANVDGNFSYVNDGHVRILYMDGHIGGSFGEEFTISDGRVVNALECTPAWEDGIQYSYVDTEGYRRYGKGYPSSGKWELCGRPTKWVEADDGEEPEPQPEPQPEEPWESHETTWFEDKFNTISAWSVTVKNGDKNDYVGLIQSYLAYYNYYAGDIDNEFGAVTEQALAKWQGDNGLTADGIANADDLLKMCGR